MGKILHKRTSGDTNTESAQSVLQSMKYGEVAASYGKGNECLIFKNSINSLKKIMSDSFNKAKYISHNNSNFKRFETKNDFQAAFDAGEIVYPCVSYIVETNEYHYMTPPVISGDYHLRVEADYAQEYFMYATPLIGENLWETMVEGTGELWLTSNSKIFSSFIVNGEEMIDQAVTSIPELGLDDIGLSIIKVPYEAGKIWDIKIQFPEGGIIFNNEDEMNRFLYEYSFVFTPITEINYYDSLKELLISTSEQPETVATICFLLGMYTLGPKKMHFIGSLPQYERPGDVFYSLIMYNGIYSRMLVMDGGYDVPPITIEIPSGDTTYGNPTDMWEGDGNLESENATFYGMFNFYINTLDENYPNHGISIIEY